MIFYKNIKIFRAFVIVIISVILFGVSIIIANSEKDGETFSKGIVIADKLNFRQELSLESEIVCVLEKGTEVNIYGSVGEWFIVYVPNLNMVGTVFGKYIHITNDEETEEKEAKKENVKIDIEEQKLKEVSRQTKLSIDEQKLLDLVNDARVVSGNKPLVISEELVDLARLKSNDMLKNKYFSHVSPQYGNPFEMMKKFEIDFKAAGENIAGYKTVEGAFDAFMKSEQHKKNILNQKFEYIGIGIIDSGEYGKLITQLFTG